MQGMHAYTGRAFPGKPLLSATVTDSRCGRFTMPAVSFKEPVSAGIRVLNGGLTSVTAI